MSEQISADIVINLLREEISQLKWEMTLLKAQAIQAQQDQPSEGVTSLDTEVTE